MKADPKWWKEDRNRPTSHWTGFSPDGKYSLVPDLGLDQIVIYKVDASKPAITPHGTGQSVPGGGPRHMRFSTDGKFIYLLNELTLSVTTFAWDAQKGTAKTLTTEPALSEQDKEGETFNSSAEILVHPNGKFVYSSNRGHDSVSVYRANPKSGKLKVIQVQPVRGAFPRNINLSPDATWLLAAGADSNTVAAHRVDPKTGKLLYQRGSIVQRPLTHLYPLRRIASGKLQFLTSARPPGTPVAHAKITKRVFLIWLCLGNHPDCARTCSLDLHPARFDQGIGLGLSLAIHPQKLYFLPAAVEKGDLESSSIRLGRWSFSILWQEVSIGAREGNRSWARPTWQISRALSFSDD